MSPPPPSPLSQALRTPLPAPLAVNLTDVEKETAALADTMQELLKNLVLSVDTADGHTR